MSDISALSQIASGATSLAGLVLVSPQNTIGYQPQSLGKSSPQGQALLFHYEAENTVSLESDITDHVVDDNSVRNDHIGLRPINITVQGYIGDLNDVPANAALAALKTAADKLTSIDAYAPGLSVSAIQAYNDATFAYDVAATVAATAISDYDTLTGATGTAVIGSGIDISQQHIGTQNLQQKMFQQFYAYWNQRTLFTVQTPWAVFQDCAIKSMRSIQDESTNVITSFEITFKPLRFASTQIVESDNKQGRAAFGATGEVDLGTQPLGNYTSYAVVA